MLAITGCNRNVARPDRSASHKDVRRARLSTSGEGSIGCPDYCRIAQNSYAFAEIKTVDRSRQLCLLGPSRPVGDKNVCRASLVLANLILFGTDDHRVA